MMLIELQKIYDLLDELRKEPGLNVPKAFAIIEQILKEHAHDVDNKKSER